MVTIRQQSFISQPIWKLFVFVIRTNGNFVSMILATSNLIVIRLIGHYNSTHVWKYVSSRYNWILIKNHGAFFLLKVSLGFFLFSKLKEFLTLSKTNYFYIWNSFEQKDKHKITLHNIIYTFCYISFGFGYFLHNSCWKKFIAIEPGYI